MVFIHMYAYLILEHKSSMLLPSFSASAWSCQEGHQRQKQTAEQKTKHGAQSDRNAGNHRYTGGTKASGRADCKVR